MARSDGSGPPRRWNSLRIAGIGGAVGGLLMMASQTSIYGQVFEMAAIDAVTALASGFLTNALPWALICGAVSVLRNRLVFRD